MRNVKKLIVTTFMIFLCFTVFSQGTRWSEKQIWDWYKQNDWFSGVNYIPSNAINYTAMWDKTSFSPDLIEREITLAKSIGFNCVRVVLQYAVYADDPKYFLNTVDKFLAICDKHGIKVMPALFDDCAFGANTDPVIGKQSEPLEGWYAWAWSPSPGHSMVNDPRTYPKLEGYVKEIITRFKNDKRVFVWDLYNEPSISFQLVKNVFAWARQVNPTQPLTVFSFEDLKEQNDFVLANSDVITFHCYDTKEKTAAYIERFKPYNRPIICTEWMNRPAKSTVEDILPLFRELNVGSILWGLVNGKTQTNLPWGFRPRKLPYLGPWQHDLFRPNLEPYDAREIELIKSLNIRDKKMI